MLLHHKNSEQPSLQTFTTSMLFSITQTNLPIQTSTSVEFSDFKPQVNIRAISYKKWEIPSSHWFLLPPPPPLLPNLLPSLCNHQLLHAIMNTSFQLSILLLPSASSVHHHLHLSLSPISEPSLAFPPGFTCVSGIAGNPKMIVEILQ